MTTLTRLKTYQPLYCRREAYRYFVEQLGELWATEKLLRAAIAVSMHALDDVDAELVEARLRALSQRVQERAPSGRPTAIQANLHAVLFDEEDFSGNLDQFYNALNSYVPAVINTKRGLPLLLSLIYKVVGEWAGLSISGVNAPGHFLVRVQCEHSTMIVDPFFRGQVLSHEEAFQRIDRVTGRRVPRSDDLLSTPTHQQWLMRLIGNLRQLFATEGRRDDLAAMTELSHALRASIN